MYSCFLKVSFFLSNLNLISLTFLRLDLCSNVFGLALLYSPKMIPYLDLIEQHPSMHNGAWLSYAELAESVRKYKKSTTSFWFALFSTFFWLGWMAKPIITTLTVSKTLFFGQHQQCYTLGQKSVLCSKNSIFRIFRIYLSTKSRFRFIVYLHIV